MFYFNFFVVVVVCSMLYDVIMSVSVFYYVIITYDDNFNFRMRAI